MQGWARVQMLNVEECRVPILELRLIRGEGARFVTGN